MAALDALTKIYHQVAERMARLPANEFLPDLVKTLSEVLDSNVTFVGSFDPDENAIETQHLYVDGVFKENFVYLLKGTPCDGVLSEKACIIERGAAELFPDDMLLKEMGVYSYAGAPLIASDGKVIGIMVTMKRSAFDTPELAVPLMQLFTARAAAIMERNQLIRDLEEAKASAEAAARAKTRFLAMMSHELRTPLNAIIGYSDALSGGFLRVPVDAKVTSYLSEINVAGRHLLTLVDDLLDYSRVELEGAVPEQSWVGLRHSLKRAITHLEMRHDLQNISIDLDVPSGIEVLFDPHHFRQILLQLIGNSIHHTRPGGRIRVVFEQNPTMGELQVIHRGDSPASDLDTVLEPRDFNPESPYAMQPEVSLGLSVVKALCEVNDASYEVEHVAAGEHMACVCLKFRRAVAPAMHPVS